MPPTLIGKLSQRLRSLMRSSGETVFAYEAEIATCGLLERVRDEWQMRAGAVDDERFGLVDLLRVLAQDGRPATTPFAPVRKRGDVLPEQRIDIDGNPRPLDAEFLERRRYALGELTSLSDVAFIELGYRCLLKRLPDPTGAGGFLTAMQAGTLDRIDVLHALNASFEGRSNGIVIAGLRGAWIWRRLERLPFVGRPFGWLRAIFAARRVLRRLDALENRSEARNDRQMVLDVDRGQADAAVTALADRFRRLQAESRMKTAAAEAAARESAQQLQRLEEALDRERVRLDALCSMIEQSRTGDSRSSPS